MSKKIINLLILNLLLAYNILLVDIVYGDNINSSKNVSNSAEKNILDEKFSGPTNGVLLEKLIYERGKIKKFFFWYPNGKEKAFIVLNDNGSIKDSNWGDKKGKPIKDLSPNEYGTSPPWQEISVQNLSNIVPDKDVEFRNFIYYAKNSEKPFSGKLFECNLKTRKLVSEKNILNGKLNGPTLNWNNNGVLLQKLIYENGKIKKIFFWYPNGNKQAIIALNDDGSIKDSSFWDKKGAPIKDLPPNEYGAFFSQTIHLSTSLPILNEKYVNFKNDNYYIKSSGKLFSGKLLVYNRKTGVLESEKNILNGKLNGPTLNWNNNGVLLQKLIYENGKIKKIFFWYPNGNKQSIINFNNDGTVKNTSFWDKNGKPMELKNIKPGDYGALILRKGLPSKRKSNSK